MTDKPLPPRCAECDMPMVRHMLSSTDRNLWFCTRGDCPRYGRLTELKREADR